MKTLHLTDDQIDDLLIGDVHPDVTAHLAVCVPCADRLEAVQTSLASFSAVSLAWGQRRSATLPLHLQPARMGLATGGRLRLAMAATAAAVLALVLALPLLHSPSATETAHRNAAPISAPQTTAQAESPTPVAASQPALTQDQQIASDNRLLQAIDRELAASEAPADLTKAIGPQDSNQTLPDATHNE